MNITNISMGQGIVMSNGKVTINGVEYNFPKSCFGNSITTVNNKVYINGYELVKGKWKRTLKAMWYMIF